VATYTVQDTREIQTMTPGGGTKRMYRVWLQTENGATGSVDVPADKWNAEDLRRILEEKADELDLAFAIGG
jgi:hypothetical protein